MSNNYVPGTRLGSRDSTRVKIVSTLKKHSLEATVDKYQGIKLQ